MKKTLLVLFAVLLVLSLAACDFLILPPDAGDGGSRYPNANDGMVCLTIGAGGGGTSRALDYTLAEIDADYFEVVFKYGSDYYQAEWGIGNTSANITIPTGNYDGLSGNDAVLFAGRRIDDGEDVEYVLLGVGVLKGTDDSGYTSKEIKPQTTDVIFSMTALKNKVNDDPTTSTFQIIGPTNLINSNNYVTATSTFTPRIDTVTVSGSPNFKYPKFRIPGVDSGSIVYTDPLDPIKAEYSVTIPNNDKVILQDDWSVSLVTTASLPGTAASGTILFYETSPVSTPVGPALDNIQKFTFEIDLAGVTNGLCAFSIDVPVCAFTKAGGIKKKESYAGGPLDKTQIWHIRGGIENDKLDGAMEETSPGVFVNSPGSGGAVLLELVEY
jgi:hypothetical protein